MKESVEPRVNISGIAPSVMGQLIDYAYTANIVISQQDAQVKTPDTHSTADLASITQAPWGGSTF